MSNKMKNFKIILFLIAVVQFLATTGYASSGSSIEQFEVDGIKVFFKPSSKEVISVRVFVQGGTAKYNQEQQGIENLAFAVATQGGTINKNKVDFQSVAEKIGAQISGSTSYDYGNLHLNCVKMFWDESWNLFMEALLQPAFEEKEFEIVKNQLVASAKQTASNPDNHLLNLSMGNVFDEHHYSRIPAGTPESLSALTLAQVKQYFQDQLVKQRVFVVVSGDVDEADLKKKVASSLGKIPAGQALSKAQQLKKLNPEPVIEDRDIATNYIRGIFLSPSMSESAGIEMRLAMAILSDRYFEELRTKRSLSYAPQSFYATAAIYNPYSVLYISTTDPKTSMQVMVDEIKKIHREGFTADELKNNKQVFITQYFMGLETNSSQTSAIGMAHMAGNLDNFQNFTEIVNNVTLENLNKTFSKYSTTIDWTYLGKKDMVKPEDFVQPEI
jgi:predicted Zn-dependent peptidase